METEVERLKAMLGDASVWKNDENKVNSNGHADASKIDAAKQSQWPKSGPAGLAFFHLKTGDKAQPGEKFCSLGLLLDEFYQHDREANKTTELEANFDPQKTPKRPLDLFYIYPLPHSSPEKPIFLVPLSQFRFYLNLANVDEEIDPRIFDGTKTSLLAVDFIEDGTPQPRYLGRAKTFKKVKDRKKAVPPAKFRPRSETMDPKVPSNDSIEAFKKKIDFLNESEKRKKARAKEKKRVKRDAKKKEWNRSLKRVQRYLGIGRPKSLSLAGIKQESEVHSTQTDHSERAIMDQLSSAISKDLNLEEIGRYNQEDHVVFISIDIEAYERDHRLVTEIGIATLDTNDIAEIGPGKGGQEWFKAIRARHFRIKEYQHLNNSQFVTGCPDHFKFGESEFISLGDAPLIISKCFKSPYSKPIDDDVHELSDTCDPQTDIPIPEPKRNIVLVGHDVMTDVRYFQSIGYDLSTLSNIHDLADTTLMHQSLRREESPRSLGSILADLDLTGWYLHNAGNDAVYTLHAMIGIAVQAMVERNDPMLRDRMLIDKIEKSTKDAIESTWEAHRGWSSDGEDSDGGVPVRPLI